MFQYLVSPISVTIANLVIEHIEIKAINSFFSPPKQGCELELEELGNFGRTRTRKIKISELELELELEKSLWSSSLFNE